MTSIKDDIDQKFRQVAIPYLEKYIAIKSLSPAFDPHWEESGEIARALELFSAFVGQLEIPGCEAWVSQIKGRTPALVIEVPPSSPEIVAPGVLLYGHLDKQPASGPWMEGTDPFEPHMRGDLLYGRGVVDDGYSIFAALLAIDALARRGLPYPRSVVIIEASEESGSPDLSAHLDRAKEVLGEIGLVVCLDAGGLDFERVWVTTSLRGNLVIRVNVKVLEHGVHSGEAGGVVPSSFRILRQLLSRIEDERTGELIPQLLRPEIPQFFIDGANALDSQLRDPLARAFPIVDGLALDGDGAQRILAQTWKSSLSAIGISGIPDVDEGGNVLRANTQLKISLRIPPSVDPLAAQDAIVELLSNDPPYGALVEIECEEPAAGWVANIPAPWLMDALSRGSQDAFGKDPGFCGEGGSIPFLAMLGERFPTAQFVATGALGPGSNAHGPNESLNIAFASGICTVVGHLLIAASLCE